MANGDLVALQTPAQTPVSTRLELVSDPLLPVERIDQRLRHFAEGVFDLSDSSHLVRLLKVLLGDSGIGDLRKRLALTRLQQTMEGSHFYDLDRFYGALFGLRRAPSERLTFDPYSGLATAAEWAEQAARDASYRSRLHQLGRAITYGATPSGMELAAEAVLSVDCDVYESWIQADASRQTYGEVMGRYSTYGAMNGTPYSVLMGEGIEVLAGNERRLFTVMPKRIITPAEAYDLSRVLRRLKPADARVVIETQGHPIHEPVTIRGAVADSEHWQIIDKVGSTLPVSPYPVPSPLPVEQPKPPFSLHHGGRWDYNAEVAGISAYEAFPPLYSSPQFDASGGVPEGWVLQAIPTQRIYVADQYGRQNQGGATFTDFPPLAAMLSPTKSWAAHAVSDGVSLVAPFAGPRLGVQQISIDAQGRSYSAKPEDFGAPASEVRIDGMPSTALVAAMAVQARAQQQQKNNKYWASIERLAEENEISYVEIRLTSAKPINRISFEVAHYPQRVVVEVYDESIGKWTTVHVEAIYDSVPAVIKFPSPFTLEYPIHPDIAGHWVPYNVTLPDTITSSRIRISMQRINSGNIPRNALVPAILTHDRQLQVQSSLGDLGYRDHYQLKQLLPYGLERRYSLALRSTSVGCVIEHRVEVPHGDPAVPIATSVDMLGSVVTHHVVDQPASGLLAGTPWRSEPQAVPNAVVSLYLDLRDGDGNSQVIDRFYLDPLYTGCHLTLYTANDSGDRFAHSNAPVSHLTGGGTAGWRGVGAGIVNSVEPEDSLYGGQGYARVHWEAVDGPGNGMEAAERFAVVAGKSYTVLIDVAREQAPPGPFRAIRTTTADDVRSTDDDDTRVTFGVIEPILGLELTGPFGPLGVVLTNRYLPDDLSTSGWHTISATFVPTVTGDVAVAMIDPAGTPYLGYSVRNFRFIEGNVSGAEAPAGVPSEADYERLTWTPVPRDYVVQKGYINLPPTATRFVKFEFTNLVAEPIESRQRTVRKTRLFPPWLIAMTDPVGSGVADANLPDGMHVARSLGVSPQIDHPDSNVGRTLAKRPAEGYGASEAWVADPGLREKLKKRTWVHGFMGWHKGQTAPRFPYVTPHSYDVVEINHDHKTGFFAGLKAVTAYRVKYVIPDDTSAYNDRFLDGKHLNPTVLTFQIDNGIMNTGPSVGAAKVVQSTVLESTHPVSAIQFATQQTNPVQVIPNDDFTNPALAQTQFLDPEDWHQVGDARCFWNSVDTTVTMLRSVAPLISTVERKPGLVQPPLSPPFLDRPLTVEDTAAEAATLGGLESKTLTTIRGTRIHAAVRFTAKTNVTKPLLLQIVAANTGEVLAVKEIIPTAGQIFEGYVAYDVDPPRDPTPPVPTWERHGLARRTVSPTIDRDNPNVAIAPPVPPTPPDNTSVRVRLVQQGKDDIEIAVDALSLFDDGIEWDFSVDGGDTWLPARGIRNNDRGVLTFDIPGRRLVWRARGYRPNMAISAIQIRPWYSGLMNARASTTHRGPNVSTYDHEQPIQDDPMFTSWRKPVPRWWFREGHRFPELPVDGVATLNRFSTFSSRSIIETIPTPTISISLVRMAGRLITEHIERPIINVITDSNGESGTMASWTRGNPERWAADATHVIANNASLHATTTSTNPGVWEVASQTFAVTEDQAVYASFDWALRNVRQSHVKIEWLDINGNQITNWFIAGGTDANALTVDIHVGPIYRVAPKGTVSARFSLLCGWAPAGTADTWWDNVFVYVEPITKASRMGIVHRTITNSQVRDIQVTWRAVSPASNSIADRALRPATGTRRPLGPPMTLGPEGP